MRGVAAGLACALVAMAFASSAAADFPYGVDGPHWHTAAGQVPNDLAGDGNDWKFAATAGSDNSIYATNPVELNGVRGAHVDDADSSVRTAWMTTTGRPDVTIAVLDSGIRWNDKGAMSDLRDKVKLNKGELPKPEGCADYDCNHDGVFNLEDYAHDSRVLNVVNNDPRRSGPPGFMTPEDLIIAFSDGTDADHNGYVDDIAGWDFLDNDNDPYDDVQYGHGTGEAEDSNAEANNGGQTGSCPNCTVLPLRVGDSFIADANNFAQAALYATDNGVSVIQEALGTLNNSHLARVAVDYAYRHGVAVIASAADEAAQHHNWPSNYPHTIVVNSVDKYDQTFTPLNPSYLQFNGCTNFSTKVTLSIPSSSCSSNATGVGAGFAGLIYSAALNARDAGKLANAPGCKRTNGDPCVLTANEVRQLFISGVDDVNFASQPEPSCALRTPGCTDPNSLDANVALNRPILGTIDPATTSYPARKGFDEFYGYGRANMANTVEATAAGQVPPEAEITSPDWYTMVDPSKPSVPISGHTFARGSSYTCRLEVAPGSEPNNEADFVQVASSWCDGKTAHTGSFDGTIANVDIAALKARFPVGTSFDGAQPTAASSPNHNNRPAVEPNGFTVRLLVTSGKLTGQDRRNLYLHRDAELLPGFPKQLTSDGASSPALADLDGNNRNELVFGTSDGRIHALRPDGSELPGFPVHTDALPLHTGGRAFASGDVPASTSYEAVLGSVAVGDLNGDGSPEVVADDMGGHVYAWSSGGKLLWKREANPDFSGKPLQPFVNVRQGKRYRTQHGFIASPVIADLNGDGKPEVIAAGMDRHVYAWHGSDGSDVSGFPVEVIDPSKITSIDPKTGAPTFKPGIGDELDQGAIVDTPAVGDITGDGKPEIVVGTNEEYPADSDGGFNGGILGTPSLALATKLGVLSPGNSRLYAMSADGKLLPGWPTKIGQVETDLLPVVGEGITGAPVIGPASCTHDSGGPDKAGVIADAGLGYLFNSDGSSCYGQSPGNDGQMHDNALQSDFAAGNGKFDTPAIPAVGLPAFGNFGGGVSFLAPAAGLLRSLDVALPEYQGGQDFLAAWDASTGQFRPGFPAPVNDLQFLTGPSVADIDGKPGEEALGGSASLDLNAFDSTGSQVSGWPKLTSDWTVANPVIGPFGADAHKAVLGLTRSGVVLGYATNAPDCSPGSWPRFHHDNANSGDYSRDAVAPGHPYGATVAATAITFTAPGDDLLCGTAKRYEAVQSSQPITGANFAGAQALPGAPAPAEAGTRQTLALPAGHRRYVAIRAVDEQGNVGPPLVIKTTG
ncbi:MAG TPA: S8 family serine peptidase [Thermoleophilaceae bacterium]